MNMVLKNNISVLAIALFAVVFSFGVFSTAHAALTGGTDGYGSTGSSGSCCSSSSSGSSSSGSHSSTLTGGTDGYGSVGYSGSCCSTTSNPPTSSSYTPPPSTPTPSCSLSADDSNIYSGDSVTLSWSSSNASSATLSGVGSVAVNGSTSVSPSQTTTYTLTVKSGSKSKTCSKTIVVTNAPTPSCNISIAPGTINRGDSAILVWSSTNAQSGSIDNGVGSVSNSGSRTVYPTDNTTYTATFTGQGNRQVTCSTSIVVHVPQVYNTPSCTITVNNYNNNYNQNQYGTYQNSQPVTINWSSQYATYGWIDNGIGSVSVSGSRTVYPTASTLYTATFVGQNGQQINCSVNVNINNYVPPPIYPNPTPYVTLSAVPYTGLDLGPVGTVLYWGFLIAWCVFAAYLIAVKRIQVSIYRWYNNMLFGSVASHSATTASHAATPVYSAHAPVASVSQDTIDPFILAQVNRAQR